MSMYTALISKSPRRLPRSGLKLTLYTTLSTTFLIQLVKKMKIQKIIDAALANKTILELNANPMRLDMDWRYWRRAAERGLMCCINPDAHALHHFDYQLAGVHAARKGWLTRENILNTRPLVEIRRYLSKN